MSKSVPPGPGIPAKTAPYLGFKLGDPSFNSPIYANFLDEEDGENCSLIWSCPNVRRDD